MVVVLMRVLWL